MRLFVFALLANAAMRAADPTVGPIKVDQAGYLPNAPKLAVIAITEPVSSFRVLETRTGKPVFTGKAGAPVNDPDSGDRVQTLDFTALTKTGKYYIEAPAVGKSWPFEINPRVYNRAFYLALRSYYGQRCGTAVDLGSEFSGYRYEACHLNGAYHQSSGKSGPKSSPKGWHDAGDYGRYVVNSGITTGTLLWAWGIFGQKLKNIRLNIPESGNGTPDILNEIRWNLEWMLSMQDDDGGVWHKQTSERFCGFVLPHKDTLPSYVIGLGAEPFKTSCATADSAAVMAIASRAYQPFDAAFAKRCLRASVTAWEWLDKHPEVLFRNPQGISTGEYGDRSCEDERLWASAELWRATGGRIYHDYFLSHYEKFRASIKPAGPPSWANVAPMALWTYVLGARGDANAMTSIREDSLRAADEIVKRTVAHGYRSSMTLSDYVWGSNGVAANYGMQLLLANSLRPNKQYVETAMENLHYLLGRNTFSLSWVTQLGANPFRQPHHRPSGADANPEPWPGLLSGGPNARKQDPAMQKLRDLPPAKMYLDEQASYATNEVAINWNAPLVFLLAGVLPDK